MSKETTVPAPAFRNLTIQDLFNNLTKQQGLKRDMIIPGKSLTMVGGQLLLANDEKPELTKLLAELNMHAPEASATLFEPLEIIHEHICEKLTITERCRP